MLCQSVRFAVGDYLFLNVYNLDRLLLNVLFAFN